MPPIYRGVRRAETATIRGDVHDSASRRPVRGAFVAARWPARQGRELTDSNGQFMLDWIEPGMVYLDVYCPSRTLRGDSLATEMTKAKVGDDAPHDLTVNVTACTEPDSSRWVGIYRGVYRSGFEESSFQFCAGPALSPVIVWANRTHRHAWVTWPDTKQTYAHPGWKRQNDKYYPWWYVVVCAAYSPDRGCSGISAYPHSA
jgi:hypothetical protein